MRRPLLALLVVLVLVVLSPHVGPADAYRVRPGDTLSGIAARFGTTVHALAAANRLDPSGVLLAGSTLRVSTPSSGRYRVRPGDSLGALAARFHTSVGALAAANGLDPNGILLAGITIRVPGGATQPVAAAVAASSPSSRYRVVAGDTLSAVAARFGTTVDGLAAANHLDPARFLLIGTVLTVPEAQAATAASPRSPVHAAVRSLVLYWADRYGVDRRLALGIAWLESGYQAAIASSAGAIGPMQVTPATRAFVEALVVGRSIPHTTSGDVEAGVAYLRYLLARFGGDVRLALAGYYQGPEGVRKHIFRVTRLYIADVLALAARM